MAIRTRMAVPAAVAAAAALVVGANSLMNASADSPASREPTPTVAAVQLAAEPTATPADFVETLPAASPTPSKPIEEMSPFELWVHTLGYNPYPPEFGPRQAALGTLPESFHEEVEALPGFAGLYIDNNAGTVMVLRTTGEFAPYEALASKYAGQDRIFVVRPAQYTHVELDALEQRILGDWQRLINEGIEVIGFGEDPVSNRVVMEVHGLTEGERFTLAARYGPRLVIVESVGYPQLLSGPGLE